MKDHACDLSPEEHAFLDALLFGDDPPLFVDPAMEARLVARGLIVRLHGAVRLTEKTLQQFAVRSDGSPRNDR